MDAIIRAIGDALRTGAIWELNGCLALLYTAWAHLAALVVAGAWAALLWWTPPGQRRANPGPDQLSGQRPWLLGIAAVVILAAFLAQPADQLLALYALAALAYLGYGAYLNSLDALAWAEALGGQGEAAATLAQGRAFISTLATWGLWLILPLAYFSLLAQGLLVHPPLTGGTPEHMITTVRTRGQGK